MTTDRERQLLEAGSLCTRDPVSGTVAIVKPDKPTKAKGKTK